MLAYIRFLKAIRCAAVSLSGRETKSRKQTQAKQANVNLYKMNINIAHSHVLTFSMLGLFFFFDFTRVYGGACCLTNERCAAVLRIVFFR